MSDQPNSLYVSAQDAGIQIRETPLTPSERKLQEMLDAAGFYEQGADGASILYDTCLKLLDKAEAAPAVPQGFDAFKAKADEVFGFVVGLGGYDDAIRALYAFATQSQPVTLTEREVGDCIDKTNQESQYGQWQFGWSKDIAANIIAALRAKQEGGNV